MGCFQRSFQRGEEGFLRFGLFSKWNAGLTEYVFEVDGNYVSVSEIKVEMDREIWEIFFDILVKGN